MNQNGTDRKDRCAAIVWGTLLFFGVWVVYLVTAYGGIRSPDAEVQYRATAGLYHEGRPVVGDSLEHWPGFGVAGGGSIFGPLQQVAALPAYGAGQVLGPVVATHWPWPLPASHYVGDTLKLLSWGADPLAPDPALLALSDDVVTPITPSAYGERLVTVLLFGPFWGALGVVCLFGAGLRLGASRGAALGAALALAFGTLHWHYAGSFFSESLATAWVAASLWALLSGGRWGALCSGTCLGLAILAHISVLLFVPFFGLGAILVHQRTGSDGARWWNGIAFSAGLAPMLGALAAWNHYRFGHVLETGRTVDQATAAAFGYGNWQWPGMDLLHVLVSPANGLIMLCPLVLLGCWGAWKLMRSQPWLVIVLGAAVLFRVLFIASRSDWHGGFALGPRYLMLCLPLLMLPLVAIFDGSLRRRVAAWILVALATTQQWLHVLGEPFIAIHRVRWIAQLQGRGGEIAQIIHVDTYPPLLYWPGPIGVEDTWVYWPAVWGPFWLQGSALPWWLWAIAGGLVASGCMLYLAYRLRGHSIH